MFISSLKMFLTFLFCISFANAGVLGASLQYLLRHNKPNTLSPNNNDNENGINMAQLNMPDTMATYYFYRGKRGGAVAAALQLNDENLPIPDVRIIKGPQKSVTIKENEAIQLPCSYDIPKKYYSAKDNAEGNKLIQLRWRKDGKLLRQLTLSGGDTSDGGAGSIREDARLMINKQNGSLWIGTVMAADAGQYQCEIGVEGYQLKNSSKGELRVIEMLKFMPQPTSKNLELGSVGKVHCKAQGTPTPRIKWLKDLTNPLPAGVEDINGTLTFKQAANEHRGNYTCVASSNQGEIKATVGINIVVAPKFSVAPQAQVEAVEQGIATFHCQATGDPIPTIQWDKDTEILNLNNTDAQRYYLLENGTLEIHNVHAEDAGTYGCTIGSSAGLKRQEVFLIVQPPTAPDLEKSPQVSLITRIVLIIMSLAFAYFMLVVGLKIWYRYRRNAEKINNADCAKKDGNSEGGAGAAGNGGIAAENEPCLPATDSINKNDISMSTTKKSMNSTASHSHSEAKMNDENV